MKYHYPSDIPDKSPNASLLLADVLGMMFGLAWCLLKAEDTKTHFEKLPNAKY